MTGKPLQKVHLFDRDVVGKKHTSKIKSTTLTLGIIRGE